MNYTDENIEQIEINLKFEMIDVIDGELRVPYIEGVDIFRFDGQMMPLMTGDVLLAEEHEEPVILLFFMKPGYSYRNMERDETIAQMEINLDIEESYMVEEHVGHVVQEQTEQEQEQPWSSKMKKTYEIIKKNNTVELPEIPGIIWEYRHADDYDSVRVNSARGARALKLEEPWSFEYEDIPTLEVRGICDDTGEILFQTAFEYERNITEIKEDTVLELYTHELTTLEKPSINGLEYNLKHRHQIKAIANRFYRNSDEYFEIDWSKIDDDLVIEVELNPAYKLKNTTYQGYNPYYPIATVVIPHGTEEGAFKILDYMDESLVPPKQNKNVEVVVKNA